MTFEELRKKYEGKIVTDEEFELLDENLEVEFERLDSEYYGIYKYSAGNEDDYFYFYYDEEF